MFKVSIYSIISGHDRTFFETVKEGGEVKGDSELQPEVDVCPESNCLVTFLSAADNRRHFRESFTKKKWKSVTKLSFPPSP